MEELEWDATRTCNGTNEEEVFRTECNATVVQLDTELRQRHGQRALVIEYAGKSQWGFGHTLSTVYLLHNLCYNLQRFCYMRLYDSDLEKMFRYANGMTWEFTEQEKSYYPNETVHVTFNTGVEEMEILLQAYDAIPVVHVKQLQHIPFDSRSWIPYLPHDGAHYRTDPRLVNVKTRGLDRCHCRFVTQPRFRQPHRAHNKLTYQFRTGFADVRDGDLKNVTHDHNKTALWFDSACPNRELFPQRFKMLTDSPGWSDYVTSLFSATLGQPHRALRALKGSTRSWGVSYRTKVAVARDVYEASQSHILYVDKHSSFVRPIVARSLCIQRVLPLTDPTSPCPVFHQILRRNLYMDITPVTDTMYTRMRVNSTMIEVQQRHLHPCQYLDAAQCAQHFVQAFA